MTSLNKSSSKKLKITLITTILTSLTVAWFFIDNTIILVVALLVFAISTLHILLKLSTIIRPWSKIRHKLDKNYQPFVSVHVACKSEPAEIVNETIKALTKLDYKNYEVIVINSNSRDKANYSQIKKYVDSLGSNFIFVHLDAVSGFKAGALNHLADLYTNKKAEVIAIVDCDYIVTPDFLSKTAGYFKNKNVGIVQAPQDYYNKEDYNIGLYNEYRSFFALVMHQSQRYNFVNFTGTMGLIRANLLRRKELKWSEWCITEDTEAGTQINSMGYTGVYVDESLGKGLMPYDYASLARQRQRWVYGNAQIISKDLGSVIKNPNFNSKQKISFLSQLTTWFHFELIIAWLYLIINSLTLFVPEQALFINASTVLASSILITVLGNMIYFLVGLRRDSNIVGRIKAYLAHYGLINVMSSGWIIYALGYKLGFNVTKKENITQSLKVKHLSQELAVSLLLILTIVIKLIAGNLLPVSVLAVSLFVISEISGVIYLNNSFIKSNVEE